MLNKIFFITLSVAMALWFGFGCVMQSGDSGKVQTIVIPGGTVSPTLGVGFDVQYDPELDNVIPGYKILTVAYTNNSMNLVQMDPVNDKWYMEDRRGRKLKAIINLRDKDPDTWGSLPKKLQVLIEYPLLIAIGSTQTIDLLFMDDINLGEFKSVIYRIGGTKQEYKILPRVD